MKVLLLVVALTMVPHFTRAQSPDGQEKDAAQAAPALRPAVTGFADIGYRWVGDVDGDFNTYQSIVTLGSGLRLFGLDFEVTDPSHTIFDRADVRASSWGGDPYNTVRVNVQRQGAYRLECDYRKIAYFNFLPSFANIGIQQGSLLDERSFDTFRRTSDLQLTLFPARRISPYLGYTRNSGGGTAITSLFGGSHNFPVSARLGDRTDTYRAGARMEANRFHLTVEQGVSSFRNEQTVTNSQTNVGDVRPASQPFLATLLQTYDITGQSVFTRVVGTATPASRLSIVGQILYSRPHTDVRFSQREDTFVSLNGLQIDSLQQLAVASNAGLPHTTASVGFEWRPSDRVRILESWMTDRLHNDSATLQNEQFVLPFPVQGPAVSLSDRLARDYSQQQLEALVDVVPNITLRGGHRYVWGNTDLGLIQPIPGITAEAGRLRRHVGLGGLSVRFGPRFNGVVDFEASPGQTTFFRTELYNYQRTALRMRYQPARSLMLTGNISLLNDSNPTPAIDAEIVSRQSQVSATWSLGGRMNLALSGDYSRFAFRSRLTIVQPATLNSTLSEYRDDGHVGSTLVSVTLPVFGTLAPRLSAGGSFFTSSGSRPTQFLQPQGTLSLTLRKGVELDSEWRWYRLSQTLYPIETFRVPQFVTRLRFSL